MNAPQFNGDDTRDDGCSGFPRSCECPECRDWRDNYEPPEANGEDFRGTEAAGYAAEQQHAARALK